MVDSNIATASRTVVPIEGSKKYTSAEVDSWTPTQVQYITKQEQLTPTMPPLIHPTISTNHFQSNHLKNVEFSPNVAHPLYRMYAPSSGTVSQPFSYPHPSSLSTAVPCPLAYQPASMYNPQMNTTNYWYSHPTQPFHSTMNKGVFSKTINGHYLKEPYGNTYSAPMKYPLHTSRKSNLKAIARYYDEYMNFGSQVVPWIFGFLKSCCLFQPFSESNSSIKNRPLNESQFHVENVCAECGQVVGKRDLLSQSMITKQPYTEFPSTYDSEKNTSATYYEGYEGWDICVEKRGVTKSLSTCKPNLPFFDVAPPRCFKQPLPLSSRNKRQESKVLKDTCFEKDDNGRILLPTFS
ncbi:uncharacterized protein LOC128883731 isoform X2 [Hylaeus volcanicus]|uniref:uncharacterized protein LOC128883731 isoform X2 n=1 Tax=Hylaeus volcanicus TaxID=313075 RepID=UPI0023B86589|nr:uncharacterized protein LOC128883731 isoform X2 [Hylaeus volcanicus]